MQFLREGAEVANIEFVGGPINTNTAPMALNMTSRTSPPPAKCSKGAGKTSMETQA